MQNNGDAFGGPATGDIQDVRGDRTHGVIFCSRRRVIFSCSSAAV
jgi:hypothetical protein